MSYDMNEVLSSRWLARTDVPQSGVDLAIKTVTKEQVGEVLEDKFALHFHGTGYKPLLLNKTNVRVLVCLYGADTSKWTNQMVCVYDDPTVSFGGRVYGGVRLRMPQPVQRPAAPPPVFEHPKFEDLRDDIPF